MENRTTLKLFRNWMVKKSQEYILVSINLCHNFAISLLFTKPLLSNFWRICSIKCGNLRIKLFISIADIAVATQFVTLKSLEIEVDKDKWPKLSSYLDFAFNNYYKFSF